ncbi:unnamed protein product [Urochloa decumbens]|uniref:NAC domain-containing protein n=1 Tax=Urochloa decumbens TaxID=240449 RepID=A0ABC9FHN4_9POAL
MASPSLGPEIFSRGFRFNPSPHDAATYYIPRLAAGAPLHEAVRPAVHHADVYASEPADLARRFPPMPKTGDRFFFSSRSKNGARAAGAGSWYLQSTKAAKDAADQAKVGEVRKLRYKKGGVFTDWLMDEFSTTLCCSEDAGGDAQFVLCNIYVSPRAAPDSAARRESAAFFAPPAPVVIPQAAAAATKRPAPPQITVQPPCPKRMRGAAVAPIPPVLPQPAGYCAASFAPPPPPCMPRTTASAKPPPLVPTRLAAPPPPALSRFAAPPPNRSPAPAQFPTRFATPPPPVPTRLAAAPPVPIGFATPPPLSVPPRFAAPPLIRSPASALPQPRQQTPLPTPPLVRACQIPAVQAPARQCPPQPLEKKTKQRMLDPFEAAGVTDEAEDDFEDLKRCLEDDAEGSTMTADEMEQHFLSLLED